MKSAPLPTSQTDTAELQGLRTGRRRLVVGAGVAAGAALAAAALQRKLDAGAPAAARRDRPARSQAAAID